MYLENHKDVIGIFIYIVHVRLQGGSNIAEGTVQIYYNRSWGSVCDSLWNQDDAHVVCIMLGHSYVYYLIAVRGLLYELAF